jgi:hypothetical protein
LRDGEQVEAGLQAASSQHHAHLPQWAKMLSGVAGRGPSS